MNDVGLFLKKNGTVFDIGLDQADLKADNGLETALAISVFTDARVNDDQLPYGTTKKRGWWGDMFPDHPGDKIGSRMWTINPAKITNETRNLAVDYCRESTRWLIEDGIASVINFSSEYNENKHLKIYIEVVKPDGTSPKYEVLWDAQKVRRV